LQNVTYQSNTNWMIRISFINVSTYDEDAVIHFFKKQFYCKFSIVFRFWASQVSLSA
jgi:hypothetical protein